jgi:hypothetical protein
MHEKIDPTMNLLKFSMKIVELTNGEFFQKLIRYIFIFFPSPLSSLGIHPYFNISWNLCWFSHELQDVKKIAKIFDFLILLPPSGVAYLSAALLSDGNCQAIVGNFDPQNEDFGILQQSLKDLPKYDFDTEKVLFKALWLMKRYPPSLMNKLLPEISKYTPLIDLLILIIFSSAFAIDPAVELMEKRPSIATALVGISFATLIAAIIIRVLLTKYSEKGILERFF